MASKTTNRVIAAIGMAVVIAIGAAAFLGTSSVTQVAPAPTSVGSAVVGGDLVTAQQLAQVVAIHADRARRATASATTRSSDWWRRLG